MADPVKVARQMFDQFLEKADPESEDHSTPKIPGSTGVSMRSLASKGGTARAASLTPKKRREIAKQAAKARWRHLP
jgi:hypothetical protein